MTAPSIEFSSGTTPTSLLPMSTSTKIFFILLQGENFEELPKAKHAASYEKLPDGPRYATEVGRCTFLHMDMTSL